MLFLWGPPGWWPVLMLPLVIMLLVEDWTTSALYITWKPEREMWEWAESYRVTRVSITTYCPFLLNLLPPEEWADRSFIWLVWGIGGWVGVFRSYYYLPFRPGVLKFYGTVSWCGSLPLLCYALIRSLLSADLHLSVLGHFLDFLFWYFLSSVFIVVSGIPTSQILDFLNCSF